MPRILSFNGKGDKSHKYNFFKSVWDDFNSLDKYVKFFLITAIAIIIATPAITAGFLIFNPHAAGNSVFVEAENMVISGNAAISADTEASSGNFIEFRNGKDLLLNRTVFSFYYPWYGNPSKDGGWIHWTQNGHNPPDDIGSSFFPQLNAYSSADPTIVSQHMQWMRNAGIGVLVYGWWSQGSREDKLAPLILTEADKQGIKVAWQIEPYTNRGIGSIQKDIKYLYDNYGSYSAFFKVSRATKYGITSNPRGVFFVYESSGLPASQWKFLMDVLHADPIYNPFLIGNSNDVCYIDGCNDLTRESHFDGLYGYNISGGDENNFGYYVDESKKRNSVFIASVGPGFDATRSTSNPNIKQYYNSPGCAGYTYDCQWKKAIDAKAEWIGIVSFNEWHEGTQIEPAVPKIIPSYTYRDYNDNDPAASPELFLNKTKQWSYNKALCTKATTDDTVLNSYINIPSTAKYKTWIRVKDDGTNNRFFVKVDGQCSFEIVDKGTTNSWNWIDYTYGVADNPNNKIAFDLTAGTHGLQIIDISPGVKIDKVILTTDMNCIPTGGGSNCDGQSVISAPSPTPAPVITATPTPTTPTPTQTVISNSPTPIVTQPILDTTLPTINILTPSNGQTLPRNSNVQISASASDNTGVARIEIYFGGALICTISQLPYACNYKLPGKPNSAFIISAKAYDKSNNTASSSIQILTSR